MGNIKVKGKMQRVAITFRLIPLVVCAFIIILRSDIKKRQKMKIKMTRWLSMMPLAMVCIPVGAQDLKHYKQVIKQPSWTSLGRRTLLPNNLPFLLNNLPLLRNNLPLFGNKRYLSSVKMVLMTHSNSSLPL